jgi:putative ABC transport system permease protein
MKLRSTLTASGVVIAIGAFVAMLSFGAGNQEHVEREYRKLGLFTTMQVYPKSAADTASTPKLDNSAIARIAAVPGVNLVYPYDALAVRARCGDSVQNSRAQALPSAALQTKIFSDLLAGRGFGSDSAREALVSSEFAKSLGFEHPDAAVGKGLVITVRVSRFDSAFAHILDDRGVLIFDRLKRIRMDSLRISAYRGRVIRDEANEVMRRFVAGFTDAQEAVSESLTICGVRDMMRGGRLRVEPIIIPFATAARFSAAGFAGTPVEMFSRISSGTFFSSGDADAGKTFSQVTVDFDPKVLYTAVRDSVEKLGFRTFSFAAQFEEVQKFFFYFDMALGVVGLIALFTASLGIINTMVMSINERRREIGVLKSLGADEIHVRGLFLVESGVIGFAGTVGGILLGWGISRIVSVAARFYMRRENVPEVELFALPLWLILIALALGVGVSMIAGFYPAARAARVDPVQALRND